MVTITTMIGNLVVQMSEEAFEAHEAKLAQVAARKRAHARRRSILRLLSPVHWLRRWSERRALRRFMGEEQARLGTALQAIDFAVQFAPTWEAVDFLRTWQEGGDLSDWPAYRPQDDRKGRTQP